MTARVGVPGAAPSFGQVTARRPRPWPSLRAITRAVLALLREAGATVIAGLDGLVVGLVSAAIVAALLSGVEKHLGVAWPVESAVAGVGLLLVALAGAVPAWFLQRLLVRAGTLVEHRLEGRGGRLGAAVRAVDRSAVRTVDGLPAAWLGALVVILWMGNVAGSSGIVGLVLPSGALTPYIMVTGFVVALLSAARHLTAGLWASSGRVRRTAITVVVTAAILVAGGAGLVLVSPGSAASLVASTAPLDGTAGLGAATLPDPGLRGSYAVRTLTYGSGRDARRPEFGVDADIVTPTVDASKVLARLGDGADEARAWFFGFDTTAMPLNGRAWIPVANGPFPLVLIVHGNHAMGDFSDPGYAYLGEHLASRGFIAASIDENFLNGSWAADWEGKEQFARAWFLLLHLDRWRAWNADPANELHGLVDLDRVALIGHSRGGEAASVAASLVDDALPPRTGADPWPTGLSIRSVVAIAPSDGQYGSTVNLDGVDLLEIAGGHDSDASGFLGLRQYARTTIADGDFKAAFWSYRSNHGQFNTAWGRSDHGDLGGATLNLAPILDPEEQRDIARTVVAAFLEASLNGVDGYRGLFRRPMTGREWLPADDIYLVRSMETGRVALTTPSAAGPVKGLAISTTGYDSVRPSMLPLRDLGGDQGTRAVELRWSAAPGEATWRLDGIQAAMPASGANAITFGLANGSEPADASSGRPAELDPLIELVSTDGVEVSLPLSRWGALPPPLVVTLGKSELLSSLGGLDVRLDHPTELTIQTYEIPLADFAAANPAFVPSHLDSFRIVLDRANAGAMWLAEVGLTAS